MAESRATVEMENRGSEHASVDDSKDMGAEKGARGEMLKQVAGAKYEIREDEIREEASLEKPERGNEDEGEDELDEE